MTLELPAFRDRDFAVEAEIIDGRVHARFIGNADMDAITPLEKILPALHQELVRNNAREVEVDFRQLEFMSSACLKLFVNWVAEIIDAPTDQQYKLRFRANADMRWQRRSLQALQCFSEHVVVET